MIAARRQHLQSDSGFTLVEVALAATVMLLAISGMIVSVTSGAQMLDTSRRNLTASNLILHHIQETRVMDWNAITNLPANRTLTIPTRFTEVSDGMTLVRSVVADSSSLYRITFAVSWTGITGSPHTLSEAAVLTKSGLNAAYG